MHFINDVDDEESILEFSVKVDDGQGVEIECFAS